MTPMPNDDVIERAREIDLRQRYMSHAAGRQRVLAQALTEAHDAALEKAAGIADLYRSSSGSFIASEIRRAKSTEQVPAARKEVE